MKREAEHKERQAALNARRQEAEKERMLAQEVSGVLGQEKYCAAGPQWWLSLPPLPCPCIT